MLGKNGGKDKERDMNLVSINEDKELDEMEGFGSGNFPTIDTLDEDNNDTREEDFIS